MIFYFMLTLRCRQSDVFATVSSPVSLKTSDKHKVANVTANFRKISKMVPMETLGAHAVEADS
jgi:hypothetical protein